jgi:Na+/H+-translocating membrane pyrophosphatase
VDGVWFIPGKQLPINLDKTDLIAGRRLGALVPSLFTAYLITFVFSTLL